MHGAGRVLSMSLWTVEVVGLCGEGPVCRAVPDDSSEPSARSKTVPSRNEYVLINAPSRLDLRVLVLRSERMPGTVGKMLLADLHVSLKRVLRRFRLAIGKSSLCWPSRTHGKACAVILTSLTFVPKLMVCFPLIQATSSTYCGRACCAMPVTVKFVGEKTLRKVDGILVAWSLLAETLPRQARTGSCSPNSGRIDQLWLAPDPRMRHKRGAGVSGKRRSTAVVS